MAVIDRGMASSGSGRRLRKRGRNVGGVSATAVATAADEARILRDMLAEAVKRGRGGAALRALRLLVSLTWRAGTEG